MIVARLLVCVDSFKGSITSIEAGEAVAHGWSQIRPTDQIEVIPFADGGEGTLDAVHTILQNSTLQKYFDEDTKQEASYLSISENVALVELASLCGLQIEGIKDPTGASSYQLGSTIREAVNRGHKSIYVALGGSASSDGGAGALEALGVRMLDSAGQQVARGNRGLELIEAIDLSGVVVPNDVNLILLTDVENVLLGQRGAIQVFAKQKGAVDSDLGKMESNMIHFASFFSETLANTPGSGAAGGTAFGLLALGGKITSGAKHLAELIDLRTRIADSDFVITGEGSFDEQSFDGKAVSVISKECVDLAIPCFLVAGRIKGDTSTFRSAISVSEIAPSLESSISSAAKWLILAGRTLADQAS